MPIASFIDQLRNLADVRVGGDRPWDIRLRRGASIDRIVAGGPLAIGESYMDGWWDCDDLEELVYRVQRSKAIEQIRVSGSQVLVALSSMILNRQSVARAWEVGEKHYDIGNDLYERMLGSTMAYSCGYWKEAATLDEAQEAKLDLVCRKIGLQEGQRVLDIGCGWGSLAKHAAENYGAEVVGVTISKEQADLARKRCAGLPVEIRLQDYRDLDETFDRVVSIGMFEHVGYKNYGTFMNVARRCVTEDGLFLLHTIGSNVSSRSADAWFDRYIFPNGMLPSIAQIGRATEKPFVVEDLHNFGADYEKTLLEWHRRSEAAWPELGERYDKRFRRMWQYYLLSLAASFRARSMQLWQFVLSPNGVEGGYHGVR
jgi:cyclopropane-fatty-acyl-phospholipid synthase